MLRTVAGVMAGAAVVLWGSLASAQTAPTPDVATDVTAAEIRKVLEAPTGGADRQIKVVDVGKYNVAVGVLQRGRTKPGAPVSAINHAQVTEVYYILSGSGTLVTGGTVENLRPLPPDGELVQVAVGPSLQGTFIKPAQSRIVGPGDVVIIPPGVYHGFSDVPDHVHYLSIRPDADHVLPAGFVNALIK